MRRWNVVLTEYFPLIASSVPLDLPHNKHHTHHIDSLQQLAQMQRAASSLLQSLLPAKAPHDADSAEKYDSLLELNDALWSQGDAFLEDVEKLHLHLTRESLSLFRRSGDDCVTQEDMDKLVGFAEEAVRLRTLQQKSFRKAQDLGSGSTTGERDQDSDKRSENVSNFLAGDAAVALKLRTVCEMLGVATEFGSEISKMREHMRVLVEENMNLRGEVAELRVEGSNAERAGSKSSKNGDENLVDLAREIGGWKRAGGERGERAGGDPPFGSNEKGERRKETLQSTLPPI